MQIKLQCTYLYKGTFNDYIRLESFVENDIELYSSGNERMATINSYFKLREFMDDLIEGKYAE